MGRIGLIRGGEKKGNLPFLFSTKCFFFFDNVFIVLMIERHFGPDFLILTLLCHSYSFQTCVRFVESVMLDNKYSCLDKISGKTRVSGAMYFHKALGKGTYHCIQKQVVSCILF